MGTTERTILPREPLAQRRAKAHKHTNRQASVLPFSRKTVKKSGRSPKPRGAEGHRPGVSLFLSNHSSIEFNRIQVL